MWSRIELKTNAKAALKNYFGKGILALLIPVGISMVASYVIEMIIAVFCGVSVTSYAVLKNIGDGASSAYVDYEFLAGFFIAYLIMVLILWVYEVLVGMPLTVGTIRFYQRSRGVPTSLSEIFVPMKNFLHIGLTMLLMSVKIFLWSLLLVVPGIIKTYEYRMVPYILAENPNISTKRAFEISKAMTNGHKFDLFVLELSFILWVLGIVFTCGLLAIYAAPYMQATMTEAYYKLKAEAMGRGEINPMELPDIYAPMQ